MQYMQLLCDKNTGHKDMKRDLLNSLRIFKQCDKNFENECMYVVPAKYLMKPILVAMLNALVDAEYLGITSVIMLIDLMHINNVRKVTQ